MIIKLCNIELDQSTQCRAEMRQEVIDEYTQLMLDGVEFPPVEVYGTKHACWLADGWHRVLAARQAARDMIDADLKHGGRSEAVKAALNANAVHGLRRTNADKRRAVEVALREFGNLSSRAIADMCGVSNHVVDRMRADQVGQNPTSTVTGQDGKTYPATKQKQEVNRDSNETAEDANPPRAEEEEYIPQTTINPVSNARQYATMAISQLERIMDDDPLKTEQLERVRNWIDERIEK